MMSLLINIEPIKKRFVLVIIYQYLNSHLSVSVNNTSKTITKHIYILHIYIYIGNEIGWLLIDLLLKTLLTKFSLIILRF